MIRELEPLASPQSGGAARAWELSEPGGLRVVITALGASIVSVELPDGNDTVDVVLGYPTAEGYATRRGFLGATIGRVANRIAHARTMIGDREVTLSENIPGAHLHGGNNGFSRKVFAGGIRGDSLVLKHASPDGDEGYPGNLRLRVTYRLDGPRTLVMGYEFVADAETLSNPTNHSYFNLAGHDAGSLAGHRVRIDADHVTGCDGEGFGTAELVDVGGTVLDLREPRDIAAVLASDEEVLADTRGYDHNYVLGAATVPREVARVEHTPSGRSLRVETTAPCLQFYTANHVNVDGGKQGVSYGPHGAVCLEPQYAPNTVELPGMRSSHLAAATVVREETRYVFGW